MELRIMGKIMFEFWRALKYATFIVLLWKTNKSISPPIALKGIQINEKRLGGVFRKITEFGQRKAPNVRDYMKY